jgi:hypothetical protein
MNGQYRVQAAFSRGNIPRYASGLMLIKACNRCLRNGEDKRLCYYISGNGTPVVHPIVSQYIGLWTQTRRCFVDTIHKFALKYVIRRIQDNLELEEYIRLN